MGIMFYTNGLSDRTIVFCVGGRGVTLLGLQASLLVSIPSMTHNNIWLMRYAIAL